MESTGLRIHWQPPSESAQSEQLIYGIHRTLFGDCLIAKTAIGICQLELFDRLSPTEARQYVQATWPKADIEDQPTATIAIAQQLFCHAAKDPDPLCLHVRSTVLQQQVWQSLLQIPRGATTTYQALAVAIGRPKAARAVGNAVGKNPIAYLIPCHRVVRQSGELGGCRWGRDRKQQLLAWEAECF
ncbi:similar to ADA regulatory protein [Synechococcus elongatus PCC 6301]|uniref:methylated-DNA--[protein]-cysteine S-methyltransferase n=1 Tax=Synechococcus sp. (strain ATCC 27144 / PCC 6301 / SAUG 1402/1) TaxID=269084 RepID=A0A0H3K9A4_SYNP6|nr:methylated-DNA--[protein]-cysteine S-methyltransferase [Synechococcus elongatus]BAD79546.1 similar to ADA regulatory protein [Synechococcus elongatus PCC 6301]